MYCINRNEPVVAFSLKLGDGEDLRRAYHIANERLPSGMVCIMNDEERKLEFFNQIQDLKSVDDFIVRMWKTFMFIPCHTKVVYKSSE